MSDERYVTLNNGLKMPRVGLGTVSLPIDSIESVISSAYDAGYRMFDLAWHYYNEAEIANAMKALSLSREDIFLTNKLHFDNLYLGWKFRRFEIPKRSVKQAFDNSCKKLKTDYFDLYLIHWPFRNYEHLWEEVIKIYETGRAKAIGVCSFEPEHLESLKKFGVKPAVNQFEINPLNTRKKLIEYCRQENIQVEAFSAFGVGRNKNVVPDLMSNQELKWIASAHQRTVAQVILRWLIQQNIVVIPRSKDANRQKENIDIFDFSLSDAEMNLIDSMNMDKFLYGNPRNTLYS